MKRRLLQIIFLFIGVCVLQSNAKPQPELSLAEEEARRIVIVGNNVRPSLLNDIRRPFGKSNITGLNTITSPNYKWPNGIVIYEFNSDFTFLQEEKDRIVKAMGVISSVSCIVFKERVNEPNYVSITGFPEALQGCWADAGMLGSGGKQQLLNLPYGCNLYQATNIHEIIHTLGFEHEQTRFDRDLFVLVQWKNIPEKEYGNYVKYPRTKYFPPYDYDFDSIMHYDMGTKGRIDMILTRDFEDKVDARKIGHVQNMSQTDIHRIRSAYRCNNLNNNFEEKPEPPAPVTTAAPIP